jgi:hypothetical protein
MGPRRLIVHALLIALVAGLSACQSAFPRACLKAEDCERTPVNGPLVLGGEKLVR